MKEKNIYIPHIRLKANNQNTQRINQGDQLFLGTVMGRRNAPILLVGMRIDLAPVEKSAD